MFTLEKKASKTKARAGKLRTDHGTINTPVFMPVGTLGSVKAVKQDELVNKINAQIILGNTYHLYLRPGHEIMSGAGGLHQFINWDRPILTDSGGYQVFSLSNNCEISEEGARFKSHLDGSKHLFTPESVVESQRILGSDFVMMLDECLSYPCDHEYAKQAMERTHRWAERGRKAFIESKARYEHRQFQFGIVQGGTFEDLRNESAGFMAQLGTEGIAIGGLSVGEPTEIMYEITDQNTDVLPESKPRYLMGVGTPANLLQSVARGIDMFDCVMPTRNGRNGQVFTPDGIVNIRNAKWKNHHTPLDESFPSDLCRKYKMSYIHHLFRNKELLGLELASLHNLTFYTWLMQQIRDHIQDDTFAAWYNDMSDQVSQRV